MAVNSWSQVSADTPQFAITIPTSSGTRFASAVAVGGIFLCVGQGDPTNTVPAPVGSFFLRTDGGATTTIYVKEGGGTTATGWQAK